MTDIPADLLTHINYAFANISADGKIELGDAYADTDKFYDGDSWDAGAKRGSFHQLEILKAAHPHLKTLISVGGWTWSARFSDVALSGNSRSVFASSCVDFIRQWGFDGVDIDWEYPMGGGLAGNANRPEDRENYTLLMQELRSQLDAAGNQDGKHYLLTIAAPGGASIIDHLELPALANSLDWINVMSYDFHGGWETKTNFNAALYPVSGDTSDGANTSNVSTALSTYLSRGVPASKLVMGVPFYGRGWSGVSSQNNGVFQSASGVPMGTWEAGIFDYHDLAANYVPTWERHWSDEGKVPWLYNSAQGVWITYDDTESMQAKAGYIMNQQLGGAMFWELSGDDAQHTLLTSLQTIRTPLLVNAEE